MKKGFYLFFFVVSLLVGCGQKGPLYFAGKKVKKEDPTAIMSTVNEDFDVTSKFTYFNRLYIEGDLAYISKNTVPNWQNVLADVEEGARAHYVLFSKGLFDPQKDYQMLIGVPVNRSEVGEIGVILPGDYIVFSAKENDINHLPDMIIEINEYFNNQTRYQRTNKSDFMLIKNSKITIYIKVNKQKEISPLVN